jgi:hypothetical protein
MWTLSVLRLHFQTGVISKQIIEKGLCWCHFLRLIKLFPELIILLNFHSQGVAQEQLKSDMYFVHSVVVVWKAF